MGEWPLCSVEEDLVIPTQAGEVDATGPNLVMDHPVGSADRISGIHGSPLVSGVNHSMLTGPWSLDWLKDLNQGGARVIFSARKKPHAGARKKGGQDDIKRRKAGGKTERRRKDGPEANQSREVSRQVSSDVAASSASVTNDWKHWVVMQGNEQVAEDDIREARRGGLLTLWDSSKVDVWASESHEFVLWCHGHFIKSGDEFSMANVYARCYPRGEASTVRLAFGVDSGVREVGGVTVEGVAPIRQAVVSHFKAVNVERSGVDSLTFKWLHPTEVSSLIKPFSLEEVKAAVWDCDSYKILGPDGVNFGFIKDFWTEMQGDVMHFIAEFHRNNSIYNFLTKVLANRLRLVMGSVIWESQAAFVRDRQILDGILIANEVVDEARRAKKELMLFKVDFEKAYDSVDWGYLDVVMGRMGFPTLWRKWIKEWVCTTTASVLVNGSPTVEFPLERGFRQGDPLSPFLFLLAAEGLRVLMDTIEAYNLFMGWANVRALRAVLVVFETILGLKVNFNKSMLVEVNIPESWLGEAASALGCRKRLSGWKSCFLPFGGRLVLLKSVLTSLPVYALSIFKAPSDTISSIESILIKKNWGAVRTLGKSLGLIGKLFAYERSMGVRQLKEFNLALLGKWCWRMLVDREGLWFRVLVARYGVERGRLCAEGTRGSLWWMKVARIRDGGGEAEGGCEQIGFCSRHVPVRVGGRRRCLGVAATVEGMGGGDVGGVSGFTSYYLIDLVPLDVATGLIWHSQVPLKVFILAWRLL
ncbi:hypothetical protein TSUD_401300 [Trifolium subterraneum]|uniref:Reverse transcriptase domain-containing protein n=1 Tax=Trifolium subterraneum TaxID=3900 RepID=A0A2Z6NNR1_TRISU|nr:hypothetical protein TSUD_401300 [Trifolium subterraneum]